MSKRTGGSATTRRRTSVGQVVQPAGRLSIGLSQTPAISAFTGERRRALLHGQRAREQGDNWAQQSSVERFAADAFRPVKQATAEKATDKAADKAMAKAGLHSATPRTAIRRSKTENRSNSTWLDTGSRN